MSVIEKVGEFLNTLTMQYELRYKWWINDVVLIVSVPHCLCWLFSFQNIITFLFEKLCCAVEILVWSDVVDFLAKLLGMPYSVVTAQQACSTEMVKKISQIIWDGRLWIMILISDWLFQPFVCQSLIGWQEISCYLILEVVIGWIILTVFSFPHLSTPFFSRPTKYVYASYGNIEDVICILVHLACILS